MKHVFLSYKSENEASVKALKYVVIASSKSTANAYRIIVEDPTE